jgi:hypothetical protein
MGLERTGGSYKQVVELFNMAPDDYSRFLNCLRRHECHVPFRPRPTTIVGRSA